MITKWINGILLVVLVYVGYSAFRTNEAGNKNIDRRIADYAFYALDGTSLAPKNQNRVYMFWATWCGPCHAQLAIINTAVKNGLLKADQVFPISIGEDPKVVQEFAKSKEYAFPIYMDPAGAVRSYLDVMATPSLAYVNAENKVTKWATGISPVAIAKAQDFLEEPVKN